MRTIVVKITIEDKGYLDSTTVRIKKKTNSKKKYDHLELLLYVYINDISITDKLKLPSLITAIWNTGIKSVFGSSYNIVR